jgi:adenylate cyclase class 2
MALEREVKLRFESAADARARILAAGAHPTRSRRLQQDCLLDTPAGTLAGRQMALRLRNDDGRAILTLKGPVQPGRMKLREEHETTLGNFEVALTVFRALGYDIGFRYEKYREEFDGAGAVVAIDETPVGTFVEIEGAETRIEELARALGRTPADYITASYRELFLTYRDQSGLAGPHMLFASRAEA